MAHEQALMIVNQMQDMLAQTARMVVNDLEDGKISWQEGFSLGLQGISIGASVMGLLKGTNKETLRDILFVLEHGDWILPPGE